MAFLRSLFLTYYLQHFLTFCWREVFYSERSSSPCGRLASHRVNLGTHGFVDLIPPPCESHRGGIQVDKPYCRGMHRKKWARCDERSKREAHLCQQQRTPSPAWSHGLVKLIPPPCVVLAGHLMMAGREVASSDPERRCDREVTSHRSRGAQV